jgi:hypothetical protein
MDIFYYSFDKQANINCDIIYVSNIEQYSLLMDQFIVTLRPF